MRLFNVCVSHSFPSAISKAEKRKLEGCTQERNENKKIRSDTAVNEDSLATPIVRQSTESIQDGSLKEVAVQRNDVCEGSKVETTNAPQEPGETITASPLATNGGVEQREDLSILTVVQLKDRLRGLNLAVGGRKQELIDRLNGHLYPMIDGPLANQDGELSHNPIDGK